MLSTTTFFHCSSSHGCCCVVVVSLSSLCRATVNQLGGPKQGNTPLLRGIRQANNPSAGHETEKSTIHKYESGIPLLSSRENH